MGGKLKPLSQNLLWDAVLDTQLGAGLIILALTMAERLDQHSLISNRYLVDSILTPLL